MPFSYHSHSGEFCLHAKDNLEDIVVTAIQKRIRILALTEHMPRDQPEDLYPEEIAGELTNFDLWRNFADFYEKAQFLRSKYENHIHILVGFEIDYIRPSSIQLIGHLQENYIVDLFVGSVHHVNTIPIDVNKEMYIHAQNSCGGSEEALFEVYFDAQYEMLQLLPPVIGHFDLIRLLSTDHTLPLQRWPGAWEKAKRNITFIVTYGGLFELNSASLRKGWDEPFPRRDICEVIISLGGRFCLSDGSHEKSQVGLNYGKVLEYASSLGVQEIHYLERLPMGQLAIDCLGPCKVRSIPVAELKNDPFFLR